VRARASFAPTPSCCGANGYAYAYDDSTELRLRHEAMRPDVAHNRGLVDCAAGCDTLAAVEANPGLGHNRGHTQWQR
jgi:hypothetical protein